MPRHPFETFEDLALRGTTFEPRDPHDLLPRPAALAHSLAVQWGVAIEIERAIKKNASF